MDAGSIDVHCVVVVYEFLCGWCVLKLLCSHKQTALITSRYSCSAIYISSRPQPSSLLFACNAYEIRKSVRTLTTSRDRKGSSRLNGTGLIAVFNRGEGEVFIIMSCFVGIRTFQT